VILREIAERVQQRLATTRVSLPILE
jgi:hypothetical protein